MTVVLRQARRGSRGFCQAAMGQLQHLARAVDIDAPALGAMPEARSSKDGGRWPGEGLGGTSMRHGPPSVLGPRLNAFVGLPMLAALDTGPAEVGLQGKRGGKEGAPVSRLQIAVVYQDKP